MRICALNACTAVKHPGIVFTDWDQGRHVQVQRNNGGKRSGSTSKPSQGTRQRWSAIQSLHINQCNKCATAVKMLIWRSFQRCRPRLNLFQPFRSSTTWQIQSKWFLSTLFLRDVRVSSTQPWNREQTRKHPRELPLSGNQNSFQRI
jgi:hypothetical protein